MEGRRDGEEEDREEKEISGEGEGITKTDQLREECK